MPDRFPLWLDLAGRSVLVVGGGSVAARRAAALLDAGASVTVVAPDLAAELPAGAELVRRPYAAGDLTGRWLVLACTDRPEVNAAVAGDAERAGVWCVRADAAAASPAWVAARASVGDVAVAVSGGGDPGRAIAVRDAVAALLREGRLPARRVRRNGPGTGRVVLVGGGPGDPDLLTLKGFRALLDADVVVHDRLAPGVLELLPAGVESVDVGKSPGGPAVTQSEINDLLVARAGRGETVVRLKGGDPFVFGRGSEEVAACAAAGVPVEVIPGVSSAMAAPTLAGVPLTERGTAQLFTVASGHVPPGDPRSTVDWHALARSGGTLVLLMAITHLRAIAAALLAGGRSPETPAAVIAAASLPRQRVAVTTLGGLSTGPPDIPPPAVVVIGEVVRAVSSAGDAPPS
jgi:uroporphyrin-III C-methyltransferase/precorrin-2 dehydrogenase/sirohydrochlorin ferrochelatase